MTAIKEKNVVNKTIKRNALEQPEAKAKSKAKAMLRLYTR